MDVERVIIMMITKNTSIDKIVKERPDTFPVFWKHGIYHVGSPVSNGETVEEICELYDLDYSELMKQLHQRMRN